MYIGFLHVKIIFITKPVYTYNIVHDFMEIHNNNLVALYNYGNTCMEAQTTGYYELCMPRVF